MPGPMRPLGRGRLRRLEPICFPLDLQLLLLLLLLLFASPR